MSEKKKYKISLQTKISIYFVIFALFIINTIGWLVYYQSVEYFDEQLGKNLESIAKSVGGIVDEEMFSYLQSGIEKGNFYNSMRAPLKVLKNSFDLKRVYIVDKNYKLLLDSEDGEKIGSWIPHLESNLLELRLSIQGNATYSTLYRAYDGNLYKSAFAPVKNKNKKTVAIACVDASPAYLNIINNIQNFVLLTNLMSLIIAILLGLVLAKTIVTPIKLLVLAAQRVSRGKYEMPVKIGSKDELGFLGEVFNSMQQNISENEQKLKELSAAVAHEIRNPLNSISLYLGLLKRKLSNKTDELKTIVKVQKEISTLNEIVEEFLYYSRSSNLSMEKISVLELIEESLYLAENEIKSNKTNIDLKVTSNELSLIGDKNQLKRALLNVIINGIQASGENGELKLKAYQELDKVIIEISDNGVGIAKDEIKDIFKPFYSKKSNGTGLGLAIVSNIIKSHEGTIFVESTVGIGTKIIIKFKKNL